MSSLEKLESRKKTLLIALSMSAAMIILTSNMAAAKITSFFGIPVDGGIVMFPFSYIVTDLLVEFFGETRANKVAVFATFVNLVAVLLLFLVASFPAHDEYEGNEAFVQIFGYFGRITVASLVSYLVSTLVNNHVFEIIRYKQNDRDPVTVKRKLAKWNLTLNDYLRHENNLNKLDATDYLSRAFKSSMAARFFDSLIFETIAFFGVLSFGSFMKQALFAYVAGTLIEAFMSGPGILIQYVVKKYLERD